MPDPEQAEKPLWGRVRGYFILGESRAGTDEKSTPGRRVKSSGGLKQARKGSSVNMLHPLAQQKEIDESTKQSAHVTQSYETTTGTPAVYVETSKRKKNGDGTGTEEPACGTDSATAGHGDVESQMMLEQHDEDWQMPVVKMPDDAALRRGKSSRSMQSCSETTPLLHRRIEAGMIENEDEAEIARHRFTYPTAFEMIALQAVGTLSYLGYVGTSWLYCSFQRDKLFPDCGTMWPDNVLLRGTCEGSFIIFWTFPLFCCMVLLMLSYRDVLHTRIWFECLAHKVLLDFENVCVYESPCIQVMIGYAVLTLPFYYFAHNLEIGAFLATLPYWIPLVSYSFILVSNWDLETRLLSLAKFVEFDPAWSFHHVNHCFFLRDFVAKEAYFNVCNRREIDDIRTTGSLIRAVTEEASGMWERDDELKETNFYNTDIHYSLLRNYWVTNLLWNENLQDARAIKFRRYFRIFTIYNGFMFALLFYLYISTIISHLHARKVMPTSIVTHVFSIDAIHFRALHPMMPAAQNQRID